jgi:hypothetical protein
MATVFGHLSPLIFTVLITHGTPPGVVQASRLDLLHPSSIDGHFVWVRLNVEIVADESHGRTTSGVRTAHRQSR